MALRFEDLRVRDGQTLDRDFFNRRYRLIAETQAALGKDLERIDATTDNLMTLGLDRVDEALAPALEAAQAAAENGFLVATSAMELTLTQGLETTIQVDDTPARPLFTPTPQVILTRQGGALADWAIFEVASYNRDNGGLAGSVVALNGAIGDGAYSDWVIAASAGLAATIIAAAADLANTLALAQTAAAQADDAAQTAQTVLANGPVSSVNGLTGIITFGMSDIPGLVDALGGKAASSHGHTIAEVTGLEAELSSIDGGSY